jgi:hypothetical protein
VANPFMLLTLIRVLIHSAPRSKQICITIIKNLLAIGIPSQIFEKTIEMLAEGTAGH